ncbi:hypothetical protein ACFL1M_00135 [Patescibacteria group bacterium]
MTKKDKNVIKNIYLYLVTFVGIFITVIGSISILDLGLKSYVFTKADSHVEYPRPRMVEEEGQEISKEEQEQFHKKELESRRQSQAANAIAMVVVGFPLYKYHWKTLQKGK